MCVRCMYVYTFYIFLIDPFIIVRYPSLSVVTSFVLKSILSGSNIAIPAVLLAWDFVFYPFTLDLFVSWKCMSSKQHVI